MRELPADLPSVVARLLTQERAEARSHVLALCRALMHAPRDRAVAVPLTALVEMFDIQPDEIMERER